MKLFLAALLVSMVLVACSSQVEKTSAQNSPGPKPAIVEASDGKPSLSSEAKRAPVLRGSLDAGVASAPPTSKVRKLRVVVRNYSLAVTDGKNFATLKVPATHVEKQKRSKKRKTLSVEYEYGAACVDAERKRTFTFAELEARLANAAALKAHRKKKYEAAAKDFLRAVELDSKFKAARTNLACAYTRLGEKKDALAILRPLLTWEPVQTYFKISTDEDLVPLLDQPEVAKLKVKAAGAIQIGKDGSMKPGFAYSKEKNLWAVLDAEHSWGSMAWESRVSIYDAGTNELLFDPVLVGWDDTDPGDDGGRILPGRKKKVAKRISRMEKFLNDMGFKVPAEYHVAKQSHDYDNSVYPTKMKFADQKLALIMRNGLRLIRGDKVVAESKESTGQMLNAAFLVKDPPTLIHHWSIDEPEGCDIESKVSGSHILSLPGDAFL